VVINEVDYLQPSTGSAPLPIPVSCLEPADGRAGEHGLTADYFQTNDLSGKPSARSDAQVNFDWLTTAPDPLATPGSDFSVRWNGFLISPISGQFQIVVTADDRVRLQLDGKVLVDSPAILDTNRSADLAKRIKIYTASVDLKAG
jgi:hypothetical protein